MQQSWHVGCSIQGSVGFLRVFCSLFGREGRKRFQGFSVLVVGLTFRIQGHPDRQSVRRGNIGTSIMRRGVLGYIIL